MTCKPIKDNEGNVVILSCSRGRKKENVCYICGKPSTSLCDATKKNGEPCDIPMCDEHRHSVGVDTDVCKYHNYPKYIEKAKENRLERDKEINNQMQLFLEHSKKEKLDELLQAEFDDWDKDSIMEEDFERKELIKLIKKDIKASSLDLLPLNDLRLIMRYINTIKLLKRNQKGKLM